MVSFLSPELLNNSQSYSELVSLAPNIVIKEVFWCKKKIKSIFLNGIEQKIPTARLKEILCTIFSKESSDFEPHLVNT